MIHRKTLLLAGALFSACLPVAGWADATAETDYLRARWDPIHFQPAISKATDEQCLACHQEVLERKPLAQSPAGLKAADALAWYQTLDTYEGEQLTFHARHLLGDYARKVMDLSCTTCHQGNDPRDETSGTSATAQQGLTMRKMVDPWVCVMCHGQFNAQKMGIPGPWLENSSVFGDSCLTCHAAIKTERHKDIAFLKADAIEEAGKKSADACYGCHGGRAWYRITFPYADRQWPGWGQPPAGAASKYPRKDPSQAAK